MIIRGYIYTPQGQPLPGQAAYIPGQFLYNTGLIDDSKPAGQRCTTTGSAGFYDLASMLDYAAARGETLREFHTLDEVNAFCSLPTGPVTGPPASPPGGGCTTCTPAPGGPPSTTGNTPPGATPIGPPGGVFGTGAVGGRGSGGTTISPGTTGVTVKTGAGATTFPWWLIVAAVLVLFFLKR